MTRGERPTPVEPGPPRGHHRIGTARRGRLVGEHRHHTECRFCLAEALVPFIDFGDVPLAGGFHPAGSTVDDFLRERVYPLSVAFCSRCGLVQVNDVIAPDLLFKDYFYRSSAIQTLADHFAGYARELGSRCPSPASMTVLELGCNDGVFLKPLAAQGFNVIGVDPATNVIDGLRRDGVRVINDYFGERVAENIVAETGQVDAIFSSNSFAHIDDMHDVMRGVKRLLKPDGWLAFEVHYLGTLLQEMQYDMMYHEHLSYYSLTAITTFLAQFGMEVFDVTRIPIHAGSVRFSAQHVGTGHRPVASSVHTMLREENEAMLFDVGTYRDFARNVEATRGALLGLLRTLKADGKRIVGYGASGRATALSAYCGLDRRFLDAVVDDAPAKQGAFTPGNHLPIVGSSVLNGPDRPDYALLFAWSFADEIAKRNGRFLQEGGRFIVPLPVPMICGE